MITIIITVVVIVAVVTAVTTFSVHCIKKGIFLWVRKCGKLTIRSGKFGNHVTVHRLTVRLHHRHTEAKFRVVCGELFWRENEWQPAFCEA